MGKSCFDGYLTSECATCPDWSDGVDGRPVGCNTSMPIMWCKAFAVMFNNSTLNESVLIADAYTLGAQKTEV